MIAVDAQRLHATTQQVVCQGFAVDGDVHGLPDFALVKRRLGIQFVRFGEIHATKHPPVLDGR